MENPRKFHATRILTKTCYKNKVFLLFIINVFVGFGLRKLLTTYNNMQPLLYSLLTGRTVLIVGMSSHEADVKSFVKALKMFVATYHRYK